MNNLRTTFLAVAVLNAAISVAQNDGQRSSSSLYLQALAKPDVSLSFDVTAQGKRFQPIWGLDQAAVGAQVIKKGINHMGKENISIGRVAFRYTWPLVNDSVLASPLIDTLRIRCTNFNQVSPTLPLVLTADQGAFEYRDAQGNVKTHAPHDYYVKNSVANNEHWAAMINSHVHWIQKNTKHPVLGISPFNEGDYWSKEEGATPQKHYQVAKLLKENYPRCADAIMVGANTLNNDKALDWYNPGKSIYEWGNTHQLAGSFDTFAAFYQQLEKDGKVGYADEMHNVAEAMVGLEYGMTYGIWWGFDSRARGEFCQISRNGSRLAYGEHRSNWTAASVWRHDDGRVKAFVGGSERQAVTTTFQLVSTDRLVYYDGYGPQRELVKTLPGGTGYQKGQTNAECVIDVTWGEDVPVVPITAGVYRLVNKSASKYATWSGDNIALMNYSEASKMQQWNVSPAVSANCKYGGDYSFYDFVCVANNATRMNVLNFSTGNANVIGYAQNAVPDTNEQWYLEYAGDGYYYIRNRESAQYLAASTDGTDVVQSTMSATASQTVRNRMQWRILPVDVKYERVTPAQVQGLTAQANAASVTLSWTANTDSDLAGYMVMRAEKGSNEWNTVGRMVTTNTFTDNTCRQGVTYIYKVKAVDTAQNRSILASEEVEATPTGRRSLVAHWQMEDNLNDETANIMDAVAYGNVSYVDAGTSTGKALRLINNNSNNQQYVQLPYEVAGSEELTVAMWVKLQSNTTWIRLFDFGYDTDHYLFLTPNGGNVMRFAIKNGAEEQTVDCQSKLPTGLWKHVAVTIGKEKTTIYVDGEVAGSSTAITISPADVRPVLNYLGRSQFVADPLFQGQIDDVRIYNFAITADDVKTIMAGGEAVAVKTPTTAAQPNVIYDLNGVRQKAPKKGINIIDGKKVMK